MSSAPPISVMPLLLKAAVFGWKLYGRLFQAQELVKPIGPAGGRQRVLFPTPAVACGGLRRLADEAVQRMVDSSMSARRTKANRDDSGSSTWMIP